MSFAARWKNRGAVVNSGVRVPPSQFSEFSQLPVGPNSEDCENIEGGVSTSAFAGNGIAAPTPQADLMRQYPHLAPCPIVNGHWVYRGQCCTDCAGRPTCGAWPEGEEFSTERPAGMASLAKRGRLQ